MPTTKRFGLCRNQMQATEGDVSPATVNETHLGLAAKMHEEVAEVVRSPGDVDEYADVLQALHDFAVINGVSWGDVLVARASKAEARGTFTPARVWRAKGVS